MNSYSLMANLRVITDREVASCLAMASKAVRARKDKLNKSRGHFSVSEDEDIPQNGYICS